MSSVLCAHTASSTVAMQSRMENHLCMYTHTETDVYLYVYLMCSLCLKYHLRPHQANLWVDDGRS